MTNFKFKTKIEFKEVEIKDFTNKKIGDAVVVFRNGRQIAYLRGSKRLKQAFRLPLSMVRRIRDNLASVIGRKPNRDEKAFWKAVAEYKTISNSDSDLVATSGSQ
jgi:hypothetical protein